MKGLKKLIIVIFIITFVIDSKFMCAAYSELQRQKKNNNNNNTSIKGIVYIVKNNDSLWKIANIYRGDVEINNMIDIIRARNKLNNNIIHPGQKIIIPSS